MQISEQSQPHAKLAPYSPFRESMFVAKRRTNIKSDYIEITEDKLENILMKHLNTLGIHKAWITPLSLLITVLVASMTATFSKTFGIEGPEWKALFHIATLASAGWLLIVLLRWCCCRKTCTLEHLISIIKNAEADSEPPTA